MRRTLVAACAVLLPLAAAAQVSARAPQQPRVWTHADTLRGSYNTPDRNWWDVTFYDLHVAISPADSSIRGYNAITYRVLRPAAEMQIDLMTPLIVDSMIQDHRALRFRRDSNAFFVSLLAPQHIGRHYSITVYYHGHPRVAVNPPWQGGFSWTHDSLGRPWIATTDQGMGASVWWPNKDTQADEPDSQRIALTVPDPLIDVSNGRLRSTKHHPDGTTTYEWFDANPINNYAIAVAAGHYAHYSETYNGIKGKLTMDYWPLDYDTAAAHRQWVQARSMMQCFEHWFGPYPWYEDGYKLIEVPNTGMEHQSAVSYGNWFQNGYRKRGSGLGLQWDFIIVHESAHEWFGNNITAKDQADMWLHEGFANYAEALYTECQFGKEPAAEWEMGKRRGVANREPLIAPYGVNAEPPGDQYNKGGLLLHTIRQVVDNDEKWRAVLTGLNRTFWHQTVTTYQVENYISKASGIDLGKVFDQYLRTTMIPEFDYHLSGDTLAFRWSNVVRGFGMPIKVTLDWPEFTMIHPTEAWQRLPLHVANPADFKVDPNFYVDVKEVEP